MMQFGSQEDSNQDIESNERVRKWLHETPDFRPQEEVPSSKNWVSFSFSNSASFTSHLETWEEESLLEALQPKNPLSRLFCCFQGIFKRSTRSYMNAVDDLGERANSSEGEENLLDISQKGERFFKSYS